MTDHERLTFLQRKEHRLEALFVQAAYREDAEVMAKVRTEYNIMFQELVTLCRRLGIIGERKWQSENWKSQSEQPTNIQRP